MAGYFAFSTIYNALCWHGKSTFVSMHYTDPTFAAPKQQERQQEAQPSFRTRANQEEGNCAGGAIRMTSGTKVRMPWSPHGRAVSPARRVAAQATDAAGLLLWPANQTLLATIV